MPSSTTPSRLYTSPEGWTLAGAAAASYLRMRAAGMPAGGVAVFYRSLAKQEQLYAHYRKYGSPVAAYPSPSAPHVRGEAMDLTTTVGGKYAPSAAHKWLMVGGNGSVAPGNRAEKVRANPYGWKRTVPSERWHFGYSRARDTKRAAGLKAKLKELRYSSLKEFQRAHGLEADGIDGDYTWTALLKAKPLPPVAKPSPPAGPTNVDFRFGQVNLEAQRFGGDKDSSKSRGTFLAEDMRCSVYCLAEVTEAARDAIRATIPGGAERWRVYPVPAGMVAVLFDSSKWTPAGKATVTFGPKDNHIHGAVRAQLVNKVSGQRLDVIAAHVRSGSAIFGADDVPEKLDDVAKTLTLVRKDVATAVAGDWNTKHAGPVIEKAGFIRATPALDSSDSPGIQAIDATFAGWRDDGTLQKLAEKWFGASIDWSKVEN